MSDHSAENDRPAAAVHEPKCDHICLKDEGHVERGEPHFYGYENPSPRRQDAESVAAKLHATTDASVWADEFIKLAKTGIDLDWDLMVGWFANAIEVGRMAGRDAEDIRLYQALEALRLTVEYVGLDTLHPVEGWSWYDVLSSHPQYADWLDSMVNPRPIPIDATAHIDGSGGDDGAR